MSYVNLTSERLVHDDAATELQVGCYSVKGVSKVILLDPDDSSSGNGNENGGEGDNNEVIESRYVAVYVDGTKIGDVDLSTLLSLSSKDKDGHTVVHVSDVIHAADATIDLSTTFCDYASNYGDEEKEWRPGSKSSCATVRSCSFTTEAFVALADSYMTADPNAGAGCYNVRDLDTILISTTDPNSSNNN